MSNLEDEMSRFEAEIAGTPGFVTSNSFGYQSMQSLLPSFPNIPAPPAPPLLIPHQVSRNTSSGNQKRNGNQFSSQNTLSQSEVAQIYNTPYPEALVTPVILSSEPKIYTSNTKQQQQQSVVMNPVMSQASYNVASNIDITALQAEVEKKLKKLKPEKVSVAAEVAISQGKASSALQSFGPDDYKRRSKNRKCMRTAGGQTWEDPTLLDWNDDDFRIFCGDLGNDVTDELLTRTFSKYPSFMKARVIRDKRTNKSKGFGFVSFKDPADFIRAMKEMNGRYVGSRPIKLRKSSWKNRNIDIVRKKEKEKTALINMLTSGNGR